MSYPNNCFDQTPFLFYSFLKSMADRASGESNEVKEIAREGILIYIFYKTNLKVKVEMLFSPSTVCCQCPAKSLLCMIRLFDPVQQ